MRHGFQFYMLKNEQRKCMYALIPYVCIDTVWLV